VKVRNGHSQLARAAVITGVWVMVAGCPAGGTAREGTTEVDRQRAAVLVADPLLAGAPVTPGDAYTGAYPGWHRTRGQRTITVPAAPDQAAAVRRAVTALVIQARTSDWQVFATRCTPAAWSVHAYRQQDGWTADLQITARTADRNPTVAAGEITVTLLAPYHLDPPELVGDPTPLGTTCLDGPPGTGSAGTDRPVDPDHRD
jgi:hypothetical protein